MSKQSADASGERNDNEAHTKVKEKRVCTPLGNVLFSLQLVVRSVRTRAGVLQEHTSHNGENDMLKYISELKEDKCSSSDSQLTEIESKTTLGT